MNVDSLVYLLLISVCEEDLRRNSVAKRVKRNAAVKGAFRNRLKSRSEDINVCLCCVYYAALKLVQLVLVDAILAVVEEGGVKYLRSAENAYVVNRCAAYERDGDVIRVLANLVKLFYLRKTCDA